MAKYGHHFACSNIVTLSVDAGAAFYQIPSDDLSQCVASANECLKCEVSHLTAIISQNVDTGTAPYVLMLP